MTIRETLLCFMAGFGEKRFWFLWSDLKKSSSFFLACFMDENNVDERKPCFRDFHLGILFLESQLNKWAGLCASSLQECIVWGIDFPQQIDLEPGGGYQ